MNILITSYPELLNWATEETLSLIKQYIPDANIQIKPYINEYEFIQDLDGIDGLLTYFIPINRNVLENAKSLKAISIASTGFSNIDLSAAKDMDIKVCAIDEYCTEEVADHTMAFILSAGRKILAYNKSVKDDHLWDYESLGSIRRLSKHILAIYGLGRIGQAVARRANAFGIKIVAYDPYIPSEIARNLNVELVDHDYIQKNATILSNHMNANAANTDLFDADYFSKLKNKPIFINVSRGQSVNEEALINALDQDLVSLACLDVLKSENPNAATHPLIQHEKTIVTPHSAFYSKEAIDDSEILSAMNLIYALKDEHSLVKRYVTN